MKDATAEFIEHLAYEGKTLTMAVKVILTKYQPQIVRITNSDPAMVQTYWPHGYEDGDTVKIIGVRGMTDLNRNEYTIIKLSDYFFQMNVDTSAMPEYEGKGEARNVMGFTAFPRDLVYG